ncbi:hypothetical protein BDK51DRAFT_29694, partial [Blyttiomyces helicus]
FLFWQMLNINSFIFGMQEFVHTLESVRTTVHTTSKKRLHFPYRHFFPDIFLRNKERSPATLRERMYKAIKLFLSYDSIYCIKSACAVFVLTIILFEQPVFFRSLGVNGTLVTGILSFAPSLGQTFYSMGYNALGLIAGSSWGIIALSTVGYDPIGLSLMTAVFAFPMAYVHLNTRFSISGILSLINYGAVWLVMPAFLYRELTDMGLYDQPVVKYYKFVIVTSVVLFFCITFNLLVYPRLARRILREKLALVIRGLDLFYYDIRSFIRVPECQISSGAAQLLQTQLNLSGQLAELETLLVFASAEPRLQAAFQLGAYRSIISGLYGLLGSLSAARWALGQQPTADEVIQFMRKPELSKASKELASSTRLFFYVYGASLEARHPLPRNLPSAEESRRKLYMAFFAQASKNPRKLQAMLESESWTRFYAYVLAIRGIASGLQELYPHFKQLMGVLAAPHEDAWDDR